MHARVRLFFTSADPTPRLFRAMFALVVILGMGTLGYMLLEDWSFSQAFYFSVITMTTVGYGDYDVSEPGRQFTIVLLLGGLGVATYSFSQFVQALVAWTADRRRRMLHNIAQLDNHYIVCGLGRIGRSVCMRLEAEGKSYVAVDQNEAAVEALIDRGGLAIIGDASADETLQRIGIERAVCIACLTSSDAENIVMTMTARSLNPGIRIISRVEHQSNVIKNERAGASHVISPLRSGADRIANALLHPGLASFLERTADQQAGFAMVEVTVDDAAPIVAKKIVDYGQTYPSVVFVARQAPGEDAHARPDIHDAINAGDQLILAGPMDDVAKVVEDARPSHRAAA